MKTHAEVDAIYRAAMTHSHDAAIDAVYQAGLADGRAEMRAETVSVPVSVPVKPTPARPLNT